MSTISPEWQNGFILQFELSSNYSSKNQNSPNRQINQQKELSFMNTRQPAQSTRDRKTSFFRNQVSSLFLQMLTLFAAILLSGSLTHAGNIIQNPGFEADSGYGYFGRGTIPSMPGNWIWGSPGNGGWWMQAGDNPVDGNNNQHSGNNFFVEWGAYQSGNQTTNVLYQDNACGAGATYTCEFWQGSTSDAFGNPDRFSFAYVSFFGR